MTNHAQTPQLRPGEQQTGYRLRVATEAIIERLRTRAAMKRELAHRTTDPLTKMQQKGIWIGLDYAADVVSELLEEFE